MKQCLGMCQINRKLRRKKVELHGGFWKIKPPTFDKEANDVVEASLINMNN